MFFLRGLFSLHAVMETGIEGALGRTVVGGDAPVCSADATLRSQEVPKVARSE